MKRFIRVFGPGLLVAATGVGAGDLATSALAGSKVGLTVLSALVIGGIFKYALNEGLAKWQFASGTTLIEGAMSIYGRLAQYLFFAYLAVWSFTVAVALMSASGIALHALVPFLEDAATAKMIYGAGLSLVGVCLVRLGGFKLFERLMSLATLLMVVAVFYSVWLMSPEMSFQSSFHWWPEKQEVEWYLAVLGGVGGTVTILCYGYWMREHGRNSMQDVTTTRIDLLLAYLITVLLGVCMVFIGSQLKISGGGATLLVQIANLLESTGGPVAGWIFRVGAFTAIFSSLLGVWQSVPYLFSDLYEIIKPGQRNPVNTESTIYRRFLYALALIPMVGLPLGFASMQKLYALCGAAFMPLLALTLILLHIRKHHSTYRNHWLMNGLYGLICLFFVVMAVRLMIP